MLLWESAMDNLAVWLEQHRKRIQVSHGSAERAQATPLLQHNTLWSHEHPPLPVTRPDRRKQPVSSL